MAVAFDAVGPSSAGASSTGSATLSWTHTNVASGVDVLAGVAVDSPADTGLTATCTIGGTSATSLGKVESGAQTTGYLQVWRRTGVGSGAQTITVTVTGGTPGDMEGGSLSFTGVTAIGTVFTANPHISTTTPSVSVTGVASTSMVAAFAGAGDSLSAATGTSRFIKNLEGAAGNSVGNAAGQTGTGTGTVSLGWTTASSTDDALLAVELQAVAGTPQPPQYLILGRPSRVAETYRQSY